MARYLGSYTKKFNLTKSLNEIPTLSSTIDGKGNDTIFPEGKGLDSGPEGSSLGVGDGKKENPMRFKPSVQPTSSEKTKPAWWFVFRHDNLLITLTDETASIPFVKDLFSLNLEPIRQQYLGTLDGHPCYSVECADDALAPDGMDFRGLRGLFKLLEKDMFRVARRAIHIKNWDKENQYCGRCGTPTKTKKDELTKVCPKCNLLHYPRLSPAIIVAVVKGNRLLLARADRFPPGMYSVLEGFVEPGESLEECVRREVKEEVGIEVKNVRYFGSQHWPFPNSLM